MKSSLYYTAPVREDKRSRRTVEAVVEMQTWTRSTLLIWEFYSKNIPIIPIPPKYWCRTGRKRADDWGMFWSKGCAILSTTIFVFKTISVQLLLKQSHSCSHILFNEFKNYFIHFDLGGTWYIFIVLLEMNHDLLPGSHWTKGGPGTIGLLK